MAVGITLEFKGATLDQYDDVVRKIGLTPGGQTGRNVPLGHQDR